MSNIAPGVTHTLTAQGRTIALRADEVKIVARGILPAEMCDRFEHLGIRVPRANRTLSYVLHVRNHGNVNAQLRREK
jgi:hypothetical protein